MGVDGGWVLDDGDVHWGGGAGDVEFHCYDPACGTDLLGISAWLARCQLGTSGRDVQFN